MTRAAATPRMGPLPASEWAPEAVELLRGNLPRADRYLSGAADAPPVPPILGLFARHARVGGPWLAFSGTLLDAGALDAYDRELLILRVAARTRCGYLLAQHVELARRAGLDPENVGAGERETALLHAVDQLIDDHKVGDETWASLERLFDEPQLIEILFVVGSYTCLAGVLNSAGWERPDPS